MHVCVEIKIDIYTCNGTYIFVENYELTYILVCFIINY